MEDQKIEVYNGLSEYIHDGTQRIEERTTKG